MVKLEAILKRGISLDYPQVCEMIRMFYRLGIRGSKGVLRDKIEENQALAREIYTAGHGLMFEYDGNTCCIRDVSDPRRRLLYGTSPLEAIGLLSLAGAIEFESYDEI